MSGGAKLKIVAASLAVAAVAGGGAALAATKPWSPKQESQAVLDDAAKQLGVTPTELSDALKKALANRVDDAVAAGLLTKEQGDALKQRIESNDLALPFGLGFGFGKGLGPWGRPGLGHGLGRPFDKLSSAASYLGLSKSELRSQLAQGKTLAQIAKDRGKSVDGLVDALVKEANAKIDAAVKAGDLTQSQADAFKAGLRARVTDLVNGRFPFPRAFRFGAPRFGFRFHFGAPRFRFRFDGPLVPVRPGSARDFWIPGKPSA